MAKSSSGGRRGGSHELRIIGGSWRGRRLHFPDAAGLRPTTDRIRETVFNWLQAQVPGARCLDLFAGSGALGLEALSRGAREVVFVERNARVAAALRGQLELLRAQGARVVQRDALSYLEQTPDAVFDIVFLDPPFRSDYLSQCPRYLEQQGWLAETAYIYLEAEAELDIATVLPENWRLLRSKDAGQVGYHLAQRDK